MRIRRANHIPRTLIGAGGARLFNMPGVVYPAHMLVGPGRSLRCKRRVYTEIPDWAITSSQAAQLLSCNPSSARELLHRKGVRHCHVMVGNGPVIVCWERARVREIAAERSPMTLSIPEKLVSLPESLQMLAVSRTTLRRYVRIGHLQEFPLRRPTARGTRVQNFYLRSDVTRLRSLRNALRRSELVLPGSRE